MHKQENLYDFGLKGLRRNAEISDMTRLNAQNLLIINEHGCSAISIENGQPLLQFGGGCVYIQNYDEKTSVLGVANMIAVAYGVPRRSQ
jgi:hypothetical protein